MSKKTRWVYKWYRPCKTVQYKEGGLHSFGSITMSMNVTSPLKVNIVMVQDEIQWKLSD